MPKSEIDVMEMIQDLSIDIVAQYLAPVFSKICDHQSKALELKAIGNDICCINEIFHNPSVSNPSEDSYPHLTSIFNHLKSQVEKREKLLRQEMLLAVLTAISKQYKILLTEQDVVFFVANLFKDHSQ